MFYSEPVPPELAQCPRCLALEDELRAIRQQLAAVGRYVTPSPGPNTSIDLERELARWQAVHPRADAAAGFRAGWLRVHGWVQPRLREWEQRWWSAIRDNDLLRTRIGQVVTDLKRLGERG
jgi:hypothetical protein